jgi:purine-nucleoside phosphorylase
MDYKATANWLREKFPETPIAGIILGTGLSPLAGMLADSVTIDYTLIPGFVPSTAPSHIGRLLFGYLGGKPVLCFQGRYHYYEGYSMEQVVFPVRVMAALGVKLLIITNASGSLRRDCPPGALAVIEDHINFMGTNPLIGKNDNELGERFPSMNLPYSPRLHEQVKAIAARHDIPLHWCVYVAVTGPSLETKAECEMFARLGADLVGMSTVPEVIAARHCGLEVLAFSVVTNYSNLFHNEAHSQDGIRENAGKATEHLQTLITELLAGLET